MKNENPLLNEFPGAVFDTIEPNPNTVQQFQTENKQPVIPFGMSSNNPNGNIKENILDPPSGWCMIVVNILLYMISIAGIVCCSAIYKEDPTKKKYDYDRYDYYLLPYLEIPIILFIVSIVLSATGFIINPPNTASVMMFCGKYIGTVKKNGMFYINPFYSKTEVSLKSETYNSPLVKVNDKIGNPIRIGCVLMWRVHDCNKALFDVISYRAFLANQCETSLRQIGCMFAYDKVNEDDVSLRSGDKAVNDALKSDLSKRLLVAGITIEEANITEVSYSSEISSAMLKRQAAEALILGRDKIVSGAVETVSQSIVELETKNICKLNDQNKARMVSNLMVVLCSDSDVQPIVNAGANP